MDSGLDPEGGAPIVGKQITFTLGGSDTCNATTNASGEASCPLTPHETGTQDIVATFAGDNDYLSGSVSRSFSITPEESTMTYTGPTVILAGGPGATLTATMVGDGSNDNDGDGGSSAPVPAQTVTLAIGTQSCEGTTDASGGVSCTIPSVSVPLGPEVVSATFAGDAFYAPSGDSKTAIVFAFPSRGAFTLGDISAASAEPATTVTWWSGEWAFENSLSAGLTPPAFKGFAANVSLPTSTPPAACAAPWTTRPGNSPPPTGGVPSYMGVLVAGSVSKSGSAISGNTVHIVVVHADPGYAPNPGRPGTGTIVASYC